MCCVFIHELHGDRKNIVFSFAVEITLEGRGLRCLLITPSEASSGPMNMKKEARQNLNVKFYILIQYFLFMCVCVTISYIKSAACLTKLTITNKPTLETERRKGVCVYGRVSPMLVPYPDHIEGFKS